MITAGLDGPLRSAVAFECMTAGSFLTEAGQRRPLGWKCQMRLPVWWEVKLVVLCDVYDAAPVRQITFF